MTDNEEYISNFKSALSQMIRAYEKIMDKYDPQLAVQVQCFMLASLASKQEDANAALTDIMNKISKFYEAQMKGMNEHLT